MVWLIFLYVFLKIIYSSGLEKIKWNFFNKFYRLGRILLFMINNLI